MIRYIFFLILTIGLTACLPSGTTVEVEPNVRELLADPAPTPAPTTAQLNYPFTLTLGQVATIDDAGLTLTFNEVVQDERCLTADSCGEGELVIISVDIEQPAHDRETWELNPSLYNRYFEQPSTTAHYGEYSVVLLEVAEPSVSIVTATFVVTRPGHPTTIQVQPNQPFALSLGSTAELTNGDLSLTFHSVGLDDRCPLQYDCDTIGPVFVDFFVDTPDNFDRVKLQHDPFTQPNQPHRVTIGNYDIELIRLDPYPEEMSPDVHIALLTIYAVE